MKPRVLISLASPDVGGPAKGLLHFLRFGGLERCHLVLLDFVTSFGPNSEYAKAMRCAGANIQGIYQKKMLDPSLVGQALNIIFREKCQILESHGYKSHVLCAIINKKIGLPWVAFVHGWTWDNSKMIIYRYLEMLLVCMATKVVPVSNGIAQRLPLFARRKMSVIPNSIDPSELQNTENRDLRLELGIAPHTKIIGVVGRLSPEKGQVVFLKALAMARQTIPNLVGMLVGDGPDKAKLKAEAARMGLGSSVIFTGHVRHIGDFYRAMDLLVLPSLSEGMPNVLLEAMLFGKPVVASRVGGVPEVVVEGKTGLMVPPRDETAICNAIVKVFSKNGFINYLSRETMMHSIDKFSPLKRSDRIIEMYFKLLNNNI